jgi:hypothetical protein
LWKQRIVRALLLSIVMEKKAHWYHALTEGLKLIPPVYWLLSNSVSKNTLLQSLNC